MKRNNVIFKVKPDLGGNVIVLLAILYLLYLVEIWEIKRLINNPESLYAILVSIIIIYAYSQFTTTIFMVDINKLVIKFPLRPFYNKFEFLFTQIDSIVFYNINTLGVYSSLDIICKEHNRKKYRFPANNSYKKMKKLLDFLENKGIPVEIKNISGNRKKPI